MIKAKDQEGFTLIELLVSLALLSLMAIYAIQAFSTLRNMNRVEAEMAAQMEVDAVVRHLRQELSDTRTVFQTNDGQNQKLYFEGSRQSLSFVEASNGEREAGGLYFVSLALDKSNTLTEKRQQIGATLNGYITEVILLRGVKSISFIYANETETMQEWKSANQLPKAIGFNFNFPNYDHRKAIEILVRLQNVN